MIDKKKSRTQEFDPVWQGAKKKPDYDVGYGKPPKSTRFKKGKSGNPRGRPKKENPRRLKLSDAPSEYIFEEEVFRLINLTDNNGEKVSLPTYRAILRAQMVSALKGNRFAQKEVISRTERLGREKQDQKISHYVELKQCKERGAKIIAECIKKEKPIPKLLPHPEDIVLNPVTAEAYVNGPETEDDELFYEHTVLLRDHMVLRHVDAEKSGKGLKLAHEGEQFCANIFFAQMLDVSLPRRYQWQEIDAVSLIMEFQDLNKKERLSKLSRDREHIDKTRKTISRLPPEFQQELDRISKEWLSA